MFICLFICLFVFYYLSHLRIPPERFSDSFLKIRLDLDEIMPFQKIVYIFIFCIYIYFLFESSRDTLRKTPWKCHNDWTWFTWDIVDQKNCFFLFVCLFVCILFFLFESSWDTPKKIFWKFCKDQTWFSWDIVDLKKCLYVGLFVFCYFFICIIAGYPQEDFLKVL